MADVNLDPAEINKFDALAERWWDPRGEFRPLHLMNPLRVAYIEERAGITGKRALDIGCGGGILTEALATQAAHVTGIDMAQAPLRVAEQHRDDNDIVNIDYQRSTAEALAGAHPASFDLVTCLEVIEHVPDPAALVASCAELVTPGGDIVLSTINRHPKAFALAIVGAEYVLRLLPRGTHQYEKFVQPAELERWGRAAGLTLRDLTGLHYDPLRERFSLGGHVDVNYLAHFTCAA